MKRRALALCTSLLLLSLMSGGVMANTDTVDQSQTVTDQSMGDAYLHAQTFTANMYGPLDSVDLYLSGSSGTMTVSLQGVTGDPLVPDGTILAQKVLGVANAGPAWIRFDFSTAPIVLPGHVYSIFMFPIHVGIYGSVADDYPGGQSLIYYNGAWAPGPAVFTGSPADYAFKTNVGVAAPTPTPTAVPTHTPTPPPPPTHTPAPAPTRAPVVTAAPAAASPSRPATSTPSAGLASPSALASVSVASADPTQAPASSAALLTAPAPLSGGPGGSGDFPTVMVAVGVVLLLGLLAVLILVLLKRRRQQTSS
jgi:hypothetical protein